MVRNARVWLGVLAAVAAAACGGGAAEGAGSEGAAETRGAWPGELRVLEDPAPALFLSSGADAPAIGYVTGGVAVRITGAPDGDRVPVKIAGPLKVRGWLPVSRLGAIVQRRGKVQGSAAYVGPGDLVGFRGLEGNGRARIEARPPLGRDGAGTLGPFAGIFPLDRLGASPPTDGEGVTPGTPHQLPAGATVEVYDRPRGTVVATLPALDPPLVVDVVKERREWRGIRVGAGPYLIGYVNAALTPAPSAARPRRPEVLPPASAIGPLPARLAAEASRPLWRVREGARVKFANRTIAVLGAPGFAREMNRYDTGEVDVFLAVDDHVAVRGMVKARDLEAMADAGAPAPAPTGAGPQGGETPDEP